MIFGLLVFFGFGMVQAADDDDAETYDRFKLGKAIHLFTTEKIGSAPQAFSRTLFSGSEGSCVCARNY